MVICQKKQKHCSPAEHEVGDCWIALSLANPDGLNLSGRFGKHTDALADEVIVSTQGKSDCQEWDTDGWSAYGRCLPKEWEQTKVTLRLVVSYFNWIWQHSTTKTTAAQRSELTENPWTWHDIAIYPTLL